MTGVKVPIDFPFVAEALQSGETAALASRFSASHRHDDKWPEKPLRAEHAPPSDGGWRRSDARGRVERVMGIEPT